MHGAEIKRQSCQAFKDGAVVPIAQILRNIALEYIIPEAVKHFMTQVKFALEMFSRSVTRAMALGTGSFV